MTFVHPLLLAGLVFVGVPVLLHLIMRQKPKHLPFPALRFLLQRHRSTQRRLQLRHLLLLALRMLLLAAACVALARPKIFSDRFSLNTERPVAAVFVIDTSYSMGYTVGGHTRLDDAKRRALELLAQLADGSRIAVLDTAEPGGEWLASLAQARERILALDLKAANYPVTTQLTPAYDLLAKLEPENENGETRPRLLYVLSDRTQASWDGRHVENLQRMRDRVPAPGVHAVFVDVGVDKPADLAVTKLEAAKPATPTNEPVLIRATVRATGAACDTELACTIDDQEPAEHKPIKLEAGQSAVVTFQRRGLTPGLHQAKVALATAGALPATNSQFVTLEVRGPRHVLTLVDDPQNAEVWALALRSGNAFTCDVKATDDARVRALSPADLAGYQAVCLLGVARPGADLWDKLARYVAGGGGLAVIPGGEQTDVSAYNSEAGQKLLPGRLRQIINVPTEAGAIWSEETYRHPVMAPFRDWRIQDSVDFMRPGLQPGAFRYWAVETSVPDVIVSYAGEKPSPALLEKSFDRRADRGRVLLFTTPLDDRHVGLRGPRGRRWNNYLQTSFYLVLVQKTTSYLCGDAEDKNQNFASGQAITVTLPASPRFPAYSLKGPGGSAPTTVQRGENQGTLQLTQVAEPGNYQVFGADGKAVALFSINLPFDECQLEKVPAEQIEALFGPKAILSPDARTPIVDTIGEHYSQPVELLPWLMLLLLILLALENLLANKFYRRGSAGTESSALREAVATTTEPSAVAPSSAGG
jgi:hypothetical protein